MKNYRIPVFVPHRGCPHDCVFCNQKHITGQLSEITAEDVQKIVEEHLLTLPDNSYKEIAFFGGSFTGIDFDKQTELLDVAAEYVKSGKVQGIRCSTRPDFIDRRILDNLKSHFVSCIELGVQSTDDEVLKKSGRGHTFEDVKRASQLIKEYGISLGLQMMLGLPGDTYEKTIKTADDLINLKPDCVRIYPTLVVEDTALWSMYENGLYTPLALEETVEWLSALLPKFNRAGVSVIRVGLQTTDEINASTVKGPYHPAIRELAVSRIILKTIENYALQNKLSKLEIECNPKCVSLVTGQKKANIKYLKSKYYVSVFQNPDVELNALKICGKRVDIYN